VRATLGAMPAVLARRWAETDRLVTMTLQRNGFLAPPGPTLRLSLGERTHYRLAAWVADQFTRPTLGLGTERFSTYGNALPTMEQWAEITIGALAAPLAGGYASVGVVFRASPPAGLGNAYVIVARVQAGVTTTRLARINAGALTPLTEVPTPWRAGDRLRGEVDGARLRVYRQDVLIVEHVDTTPFLVTGRIGIEAARVQATDSAAIEEWSGGPREECIGLLTEVGDISAALGLIEPTAEPARWDLTLSNLQPVGGVTRFAALIRHGLRDVGAFDVLGAPVHIMTAYRGAAVPLSSAVGKIERITALEEAVVKLSCGGLDALLEPRIDGRPVTYLPSSPPFGGPPELPEDPCASSGPATEIGTPPAPPPEVEPPPPGDGPAPEPDEPVASGLLGAWLVDMNYTVSYGGGPLGQDVYVGTTGVFQLPLGTFGTPIPDDHDQVILARRRKIGAGSAQFPEFVRETFLYRGPDIGGGHLGQSKQVTVQNQGVIIVGGIAAGPGNPEPEDWQVTAKVAEYRADTILTSADLSALRPQDPSSLVDPFEARIQTLGDPFGHSVQFEPAFNEGCATFCVFADDSKTDLHYHDDFFNPGHQIPANVLWEKLTHAIDFRIVGEIPLNRFAGPQIVRLEIVSASGFGVNPSTAEVTASVQSSAFLDEVYQVGGIGSNARLCPNYLFVHLTERERTVARGSTSIVG